MTEVLPLTSHATQWQPLWQAAAIFFGTFVLEDAAAVGAGVLLAAGSISWPLAFTSCFLGIWFGDIGLYALARGAGRAWFDRSSWRRFSAKVTESEQWFARRGTAILIFSRIIPGARLPTYLAAGFLRLSLSRFLIVTGSAAFVWTALVLILARLFGAEVRNWLNTYKHGGLILLGAGVVFLVMLRVLRQLVLKLDSRRLKAWMGRWWHWEFWPAWLFYPPVMLYAVWLSIKHRGLTSPTVANPGIFGGGMVGESKMVTLSDLMAHSPAFTAEAALITGTSPDERVAGLRDGCARLGITYPLILKPDMGQRGIGIKLAKTEDDAIAYLKTTGFPILIQRYAEGPNELGVFYYRFPDESHGHIFAITEKVFPFLVGDGKTTLEELIWNDPRARIIAGKYLRRFAERRQEVLPAGETLPLVASGNHAQGCIFRDGMHLCTPALIERMDDISKGVKGFYIGRYDLRYANDDDLRAGRNFKIIELNGATSEATSIYDSRNSLFSAYRTLFRQWDLVFAIGAANRRRGCKPTGVAVVCRAWLEQRRQAAMYPVSD